MRSRSTPAGVHDLDQPGGEVPLHQLPGRDVDRHHQAPVLLPGRGSLFPPDGRLPARFADDPVPEGDDQAGVLGQVDELTRGQQPPGRVPPAHQGLHPDHGRGVQIDEGLIVELEFVAFEGPVQIVARPQPSDRPRVLLQVVELDPAPPPFLGPVHGGIGIAQEHGRRVVAADREGDPHTGRDEHLTVVELEGLAQGGQGPFGGVAGTAGVGHVFEQDGELVAPEAGHGVARAAPIPGSGRPPPAAAGHRRRGPCCR